MPDEAATALTKILDTINENREKLNVINDNLKSLLNGMTTLSAAREQSFTIIETGLQELRATTQQISSEQSKTRSEIMDRIDRLQETVELVRDDARVNWATADTAINRVRNSREDIDDLQKQIACQAHFASRC